MPVISAMGQTKPSTAPGARRASYWDGCKTLADDEVLHRPHGWFTVDLEQSDVSDEEWIAPSHYCSEACLRTRGVS
jgi:hypothetical protein